MNSRANKILLVLISLISISIFVVPFGWVFFVGEESGEGHWKKIYLIEDWMSLIFYLPFVVLWTICLIKTNVLNSGIFKFLLGLTAFVVFAVSVLSSVILAQDYKPSWGVLSSLLIFPLLVGFLISQSILAKAKRNVN